MTAARKYTQEGLNKTLWGAADSSRGTVDGGIYKDYVLLVLFYKYISDIHLETLTELRERYGDDKDRIRLRLKNERFVIPEGASFDEVYQHVESDDLGERLNKALHAIEEENVERLGGIVTVDFNSEAVLGNTDQRNKMLRNLLRDFAKIDLTEASDDVIGNAYMYMVERFGADAGKKAGEFFTVHTVAELLARLAKPEPGSRICDPACGAGGLLLLAGAEIEKQGSKDYALYGQESNMGTYNLARMNMFLHGKDSANIKRGDTLNNPLLKEGDELMKFDLVVANPPFSLKKWMGETTENDPYNRFWRGLPPKTKGDYAFICHMLETAKAKEGRVAVIVPHGVLFRGAAEGKIRKSLLEDNLIDAVIGLPAGLFQTTGIPVAILILDRSREAGGANEARKDVFFVEASGEFKPGKARNFLESAHLDKIVTACEKREPVERFCRPVPLEEIAENDYNLNITRYVDTFEEEDAIDIQANLKELARIDTELAEVEAEMAGHLKALGIAEGK
jgi:type I restriction enzyme M protein